MFSTEMKTCYYVAKHNDGVLSIYEGYILVNIDESSQVEIIRSTQQLLPPLIPDFINKKFVFSDQISAVKMLERIRKDEVEYHY